jgi:hypothetical protein
MLAGDRGNKIVTWLGAAILALVGGCTSPQSVAPPAGQAGHFSPIPAPPVRSGSAGYTTILGPVSGGGSKAFTLSVRPGYLIWLGCLGTGGFAQVKNPVLGIDSQVPCGDNGSVSADLITVARLPPEREATLQVIAPRAAQWKLRIDGLPRPG